MLELGTLLDATCQVSLALSTVGEISKANVLLSNIQLLSRKLQPGSLRSSELTSEMAFGT